MENFNKSATDKYYIKFLKVYILVAISIVKRYLYFSNHFLPQLERKFRGTKIKFHAIYKSKSKT